MEGRGRIVKLIQSLTDPQALEIVISIRLDAIIVLHDPLITPVFASKDTPLGSGCELPSSAKVHPTHIWLGDTLKELPTAAFLSLG